MEHLFEPLVGLALALDALLGRVQVRQQRVRLGAGGVAIGAGGGVAGVGGVGGEANPFGRRRRLLLGVQP